MYFIIKFNGIPADGEDFKSKMGDERNPMYLNPKTLISCPKKDQFGFTREVFLDRLCDGKSDCPDSDGNYSFKEISLHI